jgi:hypothetical protein
LISITWCGLIIERRWKWPFILTCGTLSINLIFKPFWSTMMMHSYTTMWIRTFLTLYVCVCMCIYMCSVCVSMCNLPFQSINQLINKYIVWYDIKTYQMKPKGKWEKKTQTHYDNNFLTK